jgi:hypothetical protein
VTAAFRSIHQTPHHLPTVSSPKTHLDSVHVRDLLNIDPIGRLDVCRVVDLGRRVDWRVKVLKKGAILDRFVVDEDLVSVVRAIGSASRSETRSK